MKALAAVLLAVGLTSVGTAVPAAAADPAPEAVRIAWKDDTFQFVRVTWDEDAARPNRVFVRTVGQTARAVLTDVAADAGNAVDLPKAAIAALKGPLEVGVVAGTAAGETSPVATSPAFDNDRGNRPTQFQFMPSGTSTMEVWWWPGDIGYDSTFRDPLDRNVETFQPLYTAGGAPVAIGRPTTATRVTFTGPAAGFQFSVVATNEWGPGAAMAPVVARRATLTAKIPTWAAFGRFMEIRGTFVGLPLGSVVLQARNSATSPWYRVDANDFENGTYWLMALAQGTRQFRMVMPNQQSNSTVYYGTATAPVTMTTQQVVRSARFRTTTLKYGVEARADLQTNPAINGKVSLQRWNGKAWTAVKDVTIAKGVATGTFPARQLGRVAYRYYVATRTWNGLVVAAVYSPTFVLTTVR